MPRDVIILVEGGYASAGSSGGSLPKDVANKVKVAANKLTNKTDSSVSKGIALLDYYRREYGDSIWNYVRDTLYSQITRHPVQTATAVGGTASLIPAAWTNTINGVSNVLKSIPSPIAKKTAALTTFFSLIPGATGKKPWSKYVSPLKGKFEPKVIDESVLQSRIDRRKPTLTQKLLPIGLAGALGAAAMKGFGNRIPPPPLAPPIRYQYHTPYYIQKLTSDVNRINEFFGTPKIN